MRGIDLDVEPGEIFAFLGPNGAGKTTTVEILEGYRRRSGGRSRSSAWIPRGPARMARADRDRPAERQARPLPDGPRVARALRRLLPRPRAVDEVIALVGLGEKADDAREQALRRPAAPPRRRHRADRRPGAALPRRADHRLRPIGPPPGLGGDRRPARPRQDRLPHHPLHGRGAAARRPGDDHRRRARSSPGARRRTSATATRSRRGSASASPAVTRRRRYRSRWRPRTAGAGDAEHQHAGQTLNRLTGWALERGLELEGLEVSRPSLEDIYLELTSEPGE